MKKGEKIQAFVESLGAGSAHDPCYEGYFVCFNEQKYYEAHDVLEHLWLKEQGPFPSIFQRTHPAGRCLRASAEAIPASGTSNRRAPTSSGLAII